MATPPGAAASTFSPLGNRSALLAPAGFPAGGALRYKDVILEKCSRVSLAHKPSAFGCKLTMRANPMFSSNMSLQGAHQELHSFSSTGTPMRHLAGVPSQFLGVEQGAQSCVSPMLPIQRRSCISPRAFSNDIFKFRYPVITEKPEWWWRTLACVPYLIALQISDTGYFIQPFLEHYEVFENLVYFVPGAITRLPTWFSMVYCYFAYIAIVKNKEWPHYFRFHLMMGMLLETALQLVWYTSNFFPLIHYNGRFGMHYWAIVGFFYIITLLQCVRCALSGMYAHIPFISDAAYIHTLFNIGSFQRPF